MDRPQMVGGKRKQALAKVRLVPGTGNVFYKGKPLTALPIFHRLALEEPIRLYERVIGKKPGVDCIVATMGGGHEGQIQAARLALAKALVAHEQNPELKKTFLAYDRALLVADVRRKEPYKPGDSKARAKRQKSYR